MTFDVVWGFPVALYLFLGGMTSAAYYIGVLAELFSKGKYKNLARVGSYLVLIPIFIGLLLLLVDLGRPLSFWHLIFQPSSSWHFVFQSGSVMSAGVWLLVIFVVICGVIYPAFWLAEEKIGEKLPLIKGLKGKEKIRRLVGYIGLAPAFLVSIYTGVLLAATSSELWGATPFLPILFVASAGSAGVAAIVLALAITSDTKIEALEKLIDADVVYIYLEFLTLVFLLLTLIVAGQAGEAIKKILIGNLAVLFWVGFGLVGIVLPYLIDHYHLRAKNGLGKGLPVTASILGLFGGFFLRYLVLMAGYVK